MDRGGWRTYLAAKDAAASEGSVVTMAACCHAAFEALC